jgi:hypothetical protein
MFIFIFLKAVRMMKYVSLYIFLNIGLLNAAGLKPYSKATYNKAAVDERVNEYWKSFNTGTPAWWQNDYGGSELDSLILEIGKLNAQMVFISLKELSKAASEAQKKAKSKTAAAHNQVPTAAQSSSCPPSTSTTTNNI